MLIVCPSCATTYSLTEAQLGRGRTLRCANCRHTWHAAPEEALAIAGDVPALAAVGEIATGVAEALPSPVLEPEAEAPRRPRPRAAHRGRRRPPAQGAFIGRLKAAQPWQIALAGSVAALLLAVLLREPVVRAAPQTARLFAAIHLPVNLRGLAIEGVHSEVITDKDETILVVDGTVRNLRRSDTAVPQLTLRLRGPDGGEVTTWTAEVPHAVLAAGESTPFRTRLLAPPLDGRDVLVRFARNDDSVPAVR